MPLPLDVRDLIKHGSKVQKDRERSVHLALVIEPDAPDALIEAVRDALRPSTVTARVRVAIAEPGASFQPDPTLDALIGVAGTGRAGLADALDLPRRHLVPCVVVALGEGETPLASVLSQPLEDLIVEPEPEEVLVATGHWLVDRLGEKRLALAANFRFVRRAVAHEAVKSTAVQNALIGGVTIVPGADMPLMTANQAKMLLQIAAAYGQPLGAERIKELAAVVGGGFALRAVARQLLTVLPGFGWALKAGVGYTGTLAMGEAAIAYFENDADLIDVAARLVTTGETAAARGAAVLRGSRDRARGALRAGRQAHPSLPAPPAAGAQPPAPVAGPASEG